MSMMKVSTLFLWSLSFGVTSALLSVDPHHGCSRLPKSRFSTTRALHMSSNKAEDTNDAVATPKNNDDEKAATLIFSVAVDMSSDPLPKGTTVDDVAKFLSNPDIKTTLISAGGTRAVEEVAKTPELRSLWEEVCKEEYGNEMLPSDGDSILSTDTVIQFPGLKLLNKVYNAARLTNDEETGIPKYTYVLVAEEKSVSGLSPLVWIFSKLTGATDSKKVDDSSPMKPSGVAVSEITALVDTSGNLVFNFVADIKIKIRFPRKLLKILPTTKEKAEENGSTSVRKSVVKDVEKGVKGVRDAFIEFHTSS